MSGAPALPEPSAIAIAVAPSGAPYVRAPEEGEEAIDGARAVTIAAAFARGAGAGILHLGAVEVATPLPAPFAFFRDLGHELVATACARADLEEARERVDVAAPGARLEAMAGAVPPLAGAEYVTAETLRAAWESAAGELRREIAAWRGPVADYLHAKSAAWSVVGRVHFHLAENARDPEAPFAFMATYTSGLTAAGAAQHRPLGHALEAYGAARDRDRLLAILLPVKRAAERSALVRALLESEDLYHPLAWTPLEARAFLEELPALEASGIVVRVPRGWSSRRPPRPQVRVTVGGRPPSTLGAEAVLDFAVSLALDGEPLTDEEQRAILSATSGLVLIKGKWVEADGAQLREVLDHWEKIEQIASRDGVSFQEAMRLVSGATLADDATSTEGPVAAWSRVEAGPWMAHVLDGLRAPDALAAIDAGSELRATLRPYQRAGVQWLWSLHELGLGGCLADDMGLGKTLQVLALLLLRRRQADETRLPALLVVPASLVANWCAEAARFTPGLRLVVAHAGTTGAAELSRIDAKSVDAADAVLTTYGSLARVPWLAEREWGAVILDEAQAIKNPGAKQTRTVKRLKAQRRLALTGTPVENRLGDLWSLFDFLSPGLLGTPKQFAGATKRMAAEAHDGYAPLRALVRPYILRRLKTDRRVIDDLPDKTEVTAYCALTKTQATLYAQAVRDLARVLDDSGDGKAMARRGAILASLLRMKQICNHPSQWLGDGVYAPEASGKLARLRELCEPVAARQEKLLVFTQFREMTAPLARFLQAVFGREGLILDGSTAMKARKERVLAFQDEKGPPFFVLSLKAGGTGLNLTAASHVVHFDRWWNPAVEAQATDRAFRIGQKKNVLVHKFVCRGTVEERIDALITSKRALTDAVVAGAGGEAALTEMSNDEILRMVRLDLASAVSAES